MVTRVVVPEKDLEWRGEWSSSATYQVKDLVQRSGSSYVALSRSTDEDPLDRPDIWDLVALKGSEGDPGDPGVPGVPGPPGPAGGEGTAAYTHDQGTPDTTWTIAHNLGYNPNITIVDSGGTEVEGTVRYLDVNTVEVTFTVAFGGKAFLS